MATGRFVVDPDLYHRHHVVRFDSREEGPVYAEPVPPAIPADGAVGDHVDRLTPDGPPSNSTDDPTAPARPIQNDGPVAHSIRAPVPSPPAPDP